MDYSKGFGGKFGVDKQMDKSAVGFNEEPNQVVGTNYQRTRADSKTDVKSLKNIFEKGPVAEERAKGLKTERSVKEPERVIHF
jgi:hypothetical protein